MTKRHRRGLGGLGSAWAWAKPATTCLGPLQSYKVSFVGPMPWSLFARALPALPASPCWEMAPCSTRYRVRGCRGWGEQWGRAPLLPFQFLLPSPGHQVQVVGTGSEVVTMTLETKPQQRNQHTVLCHMTGLQPGGHMVRAPGRAGPWGLCAGAAAGSQVGQRGHAASFISS